MTWKRRSKRSLRRLGKPPPPVLLQMRHGNLLCQPNINLSHLGEVPARAEGADDDSQSFVRGLDMGGMVWEGKSKYKTVDAVLDDLEAVLEKIIEEIG